MVAAANINEVKSRKSEVRSLFLLRGFMPRHKNFSLLLGEVLDQIVMIIRDYKALELAKIALYRHTETS
jgi:hypothetical protein